MKNSAFSALIMTLALSVGCGGINSALRATNSMPDKLDRTLNEMKNTNATVEQQPVVISLQNMLDPNNGRVLIPLPFGIMPYAETFGKYASTDQIVKLVYLWMQDLQLGKLDEGSSAEQVAAFVQHKAQTYVALSAVCGLLPEDKVQQIIKEQIVGAGRYQTSAMDMLMLRLRFIRDVMLENGLLGEALDNAGKLEEAVRLANSIDAIASLPFAGKLQIDLHGFSAPMPADIHEVLDPKGVALHVWSDDIRDTIVVLPKDVPSVTGNAAQDKAIYLKEQARQKAASAIVDARIKAWGGN